MRKLLHLSDAHFPLFDVGYQRYPTILFSSAFSSFPVKSLITLHPGVDDSLNSYLDPV